MRKFRTACWAVVLAVGGWMGHADAQVTGGQHVFRFLQMPVSARLTALGGHQLAVRDEDPAFAWSNPAVLNPSMHGQLSANHQWFVADISGGYAAAAHHAKAWDATIHGGIRYLSYGDFQGTDPTGQATEPFRAGEYALVAGIGKRLYERLSVGANIRLVSARYERYTSLGMTADLGALYHDTTRLLSLSLVLQHIGWQVRPFQEGAREPMPFEAQLGLTKRLRHMPFRLGIVYRYLDRWNITYDDPAAATPSIFTINEPGQVPVGTSWVDNLARHFVFNGEFLLGQRENLRLAVGYHHLHRKELQLDNLRSLAGFSMGVGVRVRRFQLTYGRSVVHLGAGTNHFSLAFNLPKL